MADSDYDMSTPDAILEVRRARDAVEMLVRRARLKAALQERLAASAPKLTWILWLAPAAFLIDAFAPIPAPFRALALAGVVLIMIWAFIALVAPRRRSRASRASCAVRLESLLEKPTSTLVNALHFAPAASVRTSDGGVERLLATRAVIKSEETAQALKGQSLPDVSHSGRAVRSMLLAAFATALLAILAPRLFAMEAMRFIDPMGAHPAWSPTIFDVSIEPDPVRRGDDVRIEAMLSGVVPQAVDLIILDEALAPIDRIPMSQVREMEDSESSATGRFTYALRDVLEPMRIKLRCSTGESRIFEIPVEPRLLAREAWLEIIPPGYTGWRSRSVDLLRARSRPIKALAGSRAVITFMGDLPLAGVESTGFDDVNIEGMQLSGEAHLKAPGITTLRVSLYADDGSRLDQPIACDIEVIPDDPPEVRVEAPAPEGAMVFALAGARIPMRALAVDDIGLARADVETTIYPAAADDERYGMASVASDEASGRRWRIGREIDLDDMLLAEGDALEITFGASDGMTPAYGGPQRAKSEPIRVHIVSREQMRAMLEASGRFSHEDLEAAGLCPGLSDEDGDGECDLCGGPTKGPPGAPKPGENGGEGAPQARFFGDEGEILPDGDEPQEGWLRDEAQGLGPQAPGEEGRSAAFTGRMSTSHEDEIRAFTIMPSSAGGFDGADVFQFTSEAPMSMADIPPSYRSLVSAYFERLARTARATDGPNIEPGNQEPHDD